MRTPQRLLHVQIARQRAKDLARGGKRGARDACVWVSAQGGDGGEQLLQHLSG